MKLFLAVAVLSVAFACKKSDSSTTKENPTKAAVEGNVVIDTLETFNGGSFEFGHKIYFSRDGKVTQFGCRFPVKGNFRISFWNYTTTDLIAAATINVTDTAKFAYVNVTPIDVTANTRYVISINNTQGGVNKSYFIGHKKTNAVIMPFTTGSVTFEDLLYKGSAVSVFPDLIQAPKAFLGGFPDITFEY